MSKNEYVFKVGDIVTGKGDLGIPAAIRNFEPLADQEKELAEYDILEKNKDPRQGAFYMKMVFPPGEGGRRYRIIKGAEYKIRVEGKYEQLFNKPKASNAPNPTG